MSFVDVFLEKGYYFYYLSFDSFFIFVKLMLVLKKKGVKVIGLFCENKIKMFIYECGIYEKDESGVF